MSAFDEIEAHREFHEALAFEEWLDAAKARRMKACPGCCMPIDAELMCCEDCRTDWEG